MNPNPRMIQALVRRELKVALRSKRVLISLSTVPLIMVVGLLALASFVLMLDNGSGAMLAKLQAIVKQMPPVLQAELDAYHPMPRLLVLALVYFLAPLCLIVPLMVASMIAADSFAGEKERKTLEALLYTPTTDCELLLSKLLAAWLPAVAVTLVGFVGYSIIANLVAWPIIGSLFFPPPIWLVLVLWLAPSVVGLSLTTMVLSSAHTQRYQDAYWRGALIVLPLLLFLLGQGSGIIYFSTTLVTLLGAALWLIDGLLLWWGGRWFQRARLFSQL